VGVQADLPPHNFTVRPLVHLLGRSKRLSVSCNAKISVSYV
jgi:hypothetical protein